MKNLTSFVMAMVGWIFAISAFAANTVGTEVTGTPASGVYAIKVSSLSTGTSNYWLRDIDNTYYASSPLTSTSLDDAYVWYLRTQDDGSFTLQNHQSKAYVSAELKQTTSKDEAAHFTFTNSKLYIASGTHYVSYNAASSSTTGYNVMNVTGESAGATFALYNVTGVTLPDETTETGEVNVTYNLVDASGNVLRTANATVTAGTAASVPAEFTANASYYYTFAIQQENTTVSSSNNTFTVGYTMGEKPFDFSKYYNLFLRSGARTVGVTSETATTIATRNFITDLATMKQDTWQIVESNFGVKLLNTVTRKYVTSGSPAGLTTDASAATEFKVIEGSAGFVLQNAGLTSANALGDHDGWDNTAWSNTQLAIWQNDQSTTDGGSMFTIQEVVLDDVKATYYTDGTYDSNNCLKYGSSFTTATRSAIDAATDIPTLYAVNMEYEGEQGFHPEAGAYYRIYNNRAGKSYISAEGVSVNTAGTLDTSLDGSNNRYVRRYESTDALVPQLWQFEATEDGTAYYVKNANVGQYFGKLDNAQEAGKDFTNSLEMPVSKEYAGTYQLAHTTSSISGVDNDTQARLDYVYSATENHILHAFNGVNSDYLAYWDGTGSAGDPGSYWKIQKVTEIPVTINSTSGYASIALPFAAQVPAESGVKVYYGTKAEAGYLTLEEITSGIIPAGEGVFLQHDGGASVNLTILTDDDTALTGNVLSGATAARSGFQAGDTYVLSRKDNGEAAMLKSGLTAVPANKAYLPKANATDDEGNILSFNFGPATGIDSAISTDTKAGTEEFFDLQGRRVLFPAGGIFVSKSGKKVLFK